MGYNVLGRQQPLNEASSPWFCGIELNFHAIGQYIAEELSMSTVHGCMELISNATALQQALYEE